MSGAHARQPKTRQMKHSPFCSLVDCSKPYYAKGYCRLHWERNSRNGDPTIMVIMRGSSVPERLAHYSKPDGDCLVFTGYRDKDGYGHVNIGRDDTPAHRAAYEAAYGKLPAEIVVRHKCDNPPCIKLSHLEPGTHKDNAADKVMRGRHLYGELNAAAKLTEEQVLAIRDELSRGATHKRLAAKYGVGASTIGRINCGHNWRHLLRSDAA